MKKILILMFFILKTSINYSQTKDTTWVADVSCGQCQFGMEGKSCDLAILYKNKAYFVDGTNIDKHGDAHAKDGFCNKIRKAKVTGRLIGNRFRVSKFVLQKEGEKKE